MLRELTMVLLKGLGLCALLAAFAFTPALADVSDSAKVTEAEAGELRQWFQSLPPQRQEVLQRRMRAFKKLPVARQKELIERMRGTGLAFSEGESRNLGTLQKLPFVVRMRMHMLLSDLEQLRRGDPKGFETLKNLPAERRMRELNRKLFDLRVQRFARTLGDAERVELDRLAGAQRQMKLRTMYLQAKRERVQKLAEAHPRHGELEARAGMGDGEARRELAQLVRDISTLDDLVERFAPEVSVERLQELRAKLRDAISNIPMEKFKPAVRELGRQFEKSRKPGKPEDRESEGSRRPPAIAPGKREGR